MYIEDLGRVYKQIGTVLEKDDPSQWKNESYMNKEITVSPSIKSGGYFFPKMNIDAIAEAIELHGHCIIVFHCSKSEWTKIPEYNGGEIDFGHGVCAIDYFLYNGKKTLLLEDSTGHNVSFNKDGQRLITEDFLNKRGSGAIYFIKTLEELPYVFSKVLHIGSTGLDVKMLQTKLNKVGNVTLSLVVDGKFGLHTQIAVKNFQLTHHLANDGVVGQKTNAVLNTL